LSSFRRIQRFDEAREKLPEILERRRVPVAPAMVMLDQLASVVQVVEADTYHSFEYLARQRIGCRDEDYWPVLAAALALGCAMDRGYRLLRLRRGDLDHRSRGVIPGEGLRARAMTDEELMPHALDV